MAHPARGALIVRVMPTVACATLTILMAAGCGPMRRSEPIAGPMQITDDRVALGRSAFMAHCHQCHPTGEAGLGPGINDKPLPGFLIRMQARQGIGAMPAFGEDVISDEELNAIVRYLQALRRRGPLTAGG
jgi:mono/diheme cytochrome c family protein